jgi:hypothetical protein
MEMSGPTYHVLVVGIDAYPGRATLGGCVNDADAFEAFLIDRVGVPPEAIVKLTAPGAGAPRPHRSPRAAAEGVADRASLEAALRALGSEAVGEGDRVFVIYSGHGAQVRDPASPVYREALVPVDFAESGVLYDRTVSELIQAILARTADLTVILDCCHAAGATRGPEDAPVTRVRYLLIEDGVPPPPPLAAGAGLGRGLVAGIGTVDPRHLLVAACEAGESALEAPLPDAAGARRGVLTFTLLEVLGEVDAGRLATLRWGEVWTEVRSRVARRSAGQHPWLIGRPERRVCGGPFSPADAGYGVTQETAGFRIVYRLAGGARTGLTVGALVAVYGPTPDRFPPLGSAEDVAARLGVLVVTEAGPSTAVAAPQDDAVELPPGARGRLIRPGPADRLGVVLDPPDAALAGSLEAGGLFVVVPAGDPRAEVRVRREGGAIVVGDDVVPGGEAVLFRILDGDLSALERALFHYARYNLTLRLQRRCLDLPGALEVTLLDCSDAAAIAADPQAPALPPLPGGGEGPWRARAGQAFALQIRNTAGVLLHATALDCRADGRVELLGKAITLPPGAATVVWRGDALGAPFVAELPPAREAAGDRVVVVATTAPGIDLPFLVVEETFAAVLGDAHRDLRPLPAQAVESWTATMARVEVGGERGGEG